jgi:hypothetical protein
MKGTVIKDRQERERLQELYDYQILDTPPEAELNELAEIASLICNTPISAITLIDESRQWFKARKGLDSIETTKKDSFCQHTLHYPKEILVVNDALDDDRFKQSPFVVGNPNIRFYAGAPLETPNGNVLGTLCVLDTSPRQLGENQKKALQILAKKAMDYLNSRRLLLRQKDRIEVEAIKLKNLTDQVPGMICQFEITDEGEIAFHFVSKGISNLHLRLDPESLKASPEILFGVIHEEDIPAVRKALKDSSTTLSDGSVEFRIINIDGQIEWHAARWKPEKTDAGDVIWYGFFININNHVEYERAMEQIAFDISHVLRRPVTTLLGLTSVIEKEEMTHDKIKEYTRYIKIVSSELDQFTRKLNHTYSLKRKIITGRR